MDIFEDHYSAYHNQDELMDSYFIQWVIICYIIDFDSQLSEMWSVGAPPIWLLILCPLELSPSFFEHFHAFRHNVFWVQLVLSLSHSCLG